MSTYDTLSEIVFNEISDMKLYVGSGWLRGCFYGENQPLLNCSMAMTKGERNLKYMKTHV